jgi:hypothetical protein
MTMQMVRRCVTQRTCTASDSTCEGDDRQPAADSSIIVHITARSTCHTMAESWRADPSPPQAMGDVDCGEVVAIVDKR